MARVVRASDQMCLLSMDRKYPSGGAYSLVTTARPAGILEIIIYSVRGLRLVTTISIVPG